MTQIDSFLKKIAELETRLFLSEANRDMEHQELELLKERQRDGDAKQLQLINDSLRYRLALETIANEATCYPVKLAKQAISGNLWEE